MSGHMYVFYFHIFCFVFFFCFLFCFVLFCFVLCCLFLFFVVFFCCFLAMVPDRVLVQIIDFSEQDEKANC